MSQDDKAPDHSSSEAEADTALGSAQDVIAAFGGIRPTANKLGVAVSTVQGWKERNAIPPSRHAQIREAAAQQGIDLKRPPAEITLPPEDVIVLDDQSSEPAVDAEEEALTDGDKDRDGAEAEEAVEVDATADRTADMARARLRSGDAEEKPQSSVASQVTRASEERAAASGASAAAAASQTSGRSSAGSGLLYGFLLGIFAISLGFGGAVISKDYWLPLVGQIGPQAAAPGIDKAAVDKLESQISSQSQALQDLRRKLDALPREGSSADMDAMITGLTGEIEGRLKALERGGRDAADARQQSQRVGAELAGVADRTAVLEARLSDLDRLNLIVDGLQRESGPPAAARDVAIMLSLVQLREALSRGAAYRAELDSLRGAIGNDIGLLAHLSPLEAHADAGLPTVASLSAAFSQVAKDIVSAAAGGEEEGVVSDVLRSLSSVVSVRPIGEVEGEGPTAITARAEARLRDGDLAGALEILAALNGAAADAASDWRGQAEARLAAEQALGNLGRDAVDRLAETG